MQRIACMKQVLGIALLVLAGSCAGGTGGSSPVIQPGRAELQIFVEPNPIVARAVSEDVYDFPFSIGIVERGGVDVEIQRVGINVIALGVINLYSQTYNRQQITRMGYPTSLRAHGEIRYDLKPREKVPDERLFGGVAAELFVEGVDANGVAVRATDRVTLTR